MVSALRADADFFHSLKYPGRRSTRWTRARVLLGSRGLLLIAEHRLAARWCSGRPSEGILGEVRRVATIFLDYLLRVLTKSEIRLDSVLEGGVYLSDRGHMILGARTIGAGTIIHDRVTIGWSLRAEGTPEIGRNVWIGPCALIAGNIKVGDGATILADTVLTRSVPPGVVMQGNPAQVVRRDFDNTALRASLSTDVRHLLHPERRG